MEFAKVEMDGTEWLCAPEDMEIAQGLISPGEDVVAILVHTEC